MYESSVPIFAERLKRLVTLNNSLVINSLYHNIFDFPILLKNEKLGLATIVKINSLR